jgi:5-methyltetrahydrofolate--homocysteine methyltransferase
VHVLDASRAVGVCSALLSESGSQAEDFAIRRRRRVRGVARTRRLAPAGEGDALGGARQRFKIDWSAYAAEARLPRHARVRRLPAAHELVAASTGRRSSAPGSWPALSGHPRGRVVGDSARKLFADARKMLDLIVRRSG